MIRKLLTTLGVVLLLCTPLYANQSATLTWNKGTETDLAGTKVYRAAQTCASIVGNIPGPAIAVVGTVNTYTDTTIADTVADICYAITDYDTSGNESLQSLKVGKHYTIIKPSVTNFGVVAKSDTVVTVSGTLGPDGKGGVSKIDVRIGAPGDSWGIMTSVPSCRTVLPCDITGLTKQTTYVVQAVPFSGTMSVDAIFGDLTTQLQVTTLGDTTPPIPPTGLVIASATLDKIVITCAKTDCSDIKVSTAGSGVKGSTKLVRTLTRVK